MIESFNKIRELEAEYISGSIDELDDQFNYDSVIISRMRNRDKFESKNQYRKFHREALSTLKKRLKIYDEKAKFIRDHIDLPEFKPQD